MHTIPTSYHLSFLSHTATTYIVILGSSCVRVFTVHEEKKNQSVAVILQSKSCRRTKNITSFWYVVSSVDRYLFIIMIFLCLNINIFLKMLLLFIFLVFVNKFQFAAKNCGANVRCRTWCTDAQSYIKFCQTCAAPQPSFGKKKRKKKTNNSLIVANFRLKPFLLSISVKTSDNFFGSVIILSNLSMFHIFQMFKKRSNVGCI